MKRVGIVGFGRFGQLLAGILHDDFDVAVVEKDAKLQDQAKQDGYTVMPFEALGKADVIFLVVPISSAAAVIEKLSPIVKKHQTIMDTCSVKLYPAKLMQQHLPQAQTLATHPLFGPDSAKDGLKGLKLALCPLDADKKTASFWQNFWEKKGVEVTRTTPEAHDRDMVYSLALTQTLARLVDRMNLPELSLTTKGFDSVKSTLDFSLSDTNQLYHDMLYYNPFFLEMRDRLKKASAKTLHQLDHIAEEQNTALRMAQSK